MIGSIRLKLGLAAMLGGWLAGAASAQQPTPNAPVRAVYVTGQDGNSKVYYVTGVVPVEKLPPVAPASLPPSAVKPMLAAPLRPSPVRTDVPAAPAQLPPVAEMHAIPEVDGGDSSASCATGHCGKGSHCKHGQTSAWVCARTPATIVPPLGSSVRGVFDMQRENALGEYFVVYREDWLDAKFILNDSGIRHVDGITRRLGLIGAPVKVEPTGIAELDSRRVLAIVEKLVQSGVSPQEAGSRVILGTTRAEGLRYHDIENLNGRSGGNGGGGYGGGGFGGGGFGGGGYGGGGYGGGGFGGGGFGGFR